MSRTDSRGGRSPVDQFYVQVRIDLLEEAGGVLQDLYMLCGNSFRREGRCQSFRRPDMSRAGRRREDEQPPVFDPPPVIC
jgi:hypothetical protein